MTKKNRYKNTLLSFISKNGISSSGNEKLDVILEIPLKNETEKNCWQEDSGMMSSSAN